MHQASSTSSNLNDKHRKSSTLKSVTQNLHQNRAWAGAWFEDESDANDSVERLGEVEDALASITGGDWRENDLLQSPDDVPEEIWNRGGSWWGDSAPDDPASRTSLDQ